MLTHYDLAMYIYMYIPHLQMAGYVYGGTCNSDMDVIYIFVKASDCSHAQLRHKVSLHVQEHITKLTSTIFSAQVPETVFL